MIDSDNADINVEDGRENDIVEDALKSIEYAKQKINLIRSQRLLAEAVYYGGLPTAKSGQDETDSDSEECTAELGDKIDRLCIQEGAMQFSLENDTIGKLRSSEATSSELKELLEIHCKQEAEIVSAASKLFEEWSKLQAAQSNLTQELEEYMVYENKRSRQLKEKSGTEDKEYMQKLRKQVTEIRFMQLLIPRMILLRDGDLSETEWLKKLCQEVRDPILSLDDLQ